MLPVLLHISLIEPLDGADCGGSSTLGYGGLIIWILLSLYLFVGLYVLCEEYFVPSLVVLGEKLKLSDDVCGATLMAAGSSSPELFTALIGVFLYSEKENPGPATNCASAAFNQCIIVGLSIICCGRKTLELSGYPFVRDCFFYALSCGELYLFWEVISPSQISAGESFFLVFTWCVYISVLYYNDFSIRCVIRLCQLVGINPPSSLLYNQFDNSKSLDDHIDQDTTIDCMDELVKQKIIMNQVKMDNSDEDSQFEAIDGKANGCETGSEIEIAECKSISATDNNEFHDNLETKKTTVEKTIDPIDVIDGIEERETVNSLVKLNSDKTHEKILIKLKQKLSNDKKLNITNAPLEKMPFVTKTPPPVNITKQSKIHTINTITASGIGVPKTQKHELQTESLILKILLIPFRFMFSYTIPDLNSPGYHTSINKSTNSQAMHQDPHDANNRPISEIITYCKLLAIFIASIVWMGFLTFLAVDAANKIGNCVKLNADVMGLTLLAIGSSLPDCFSSILVAKQGKGTMAVSNALGSNVFDICICVGLSFFLKSVMIGFKTLDVESDTGFELFLLALGVLLIILCFLLYKSSLTLKLFHGYILCAAYIIFIIAFSVALD